ncbi:MAG: 2,3-bisphosphoglycerate-independent phosphoglycerate mutase [Coriobacteriales bacterium]|jgi:2,3-bisphosphoglycerate-independent phosphoglycerate mutase|nr:2,3-bisphosphoglycerate-independent phosphoglycerate mutase [Coriobacteriales bacterium]
MTQDSSEVRYVVVITDGASGEPLPEFNGKTSLEEARTPHLDALAAEGALGLAKTVPDDLEPSSNVACTSICGYDPELYPIGRGALEGAALGIQLADDEVALRLNLTSVSPEGIMVSYSTDNISAADGHALLSELREALDDGSFTLHIGTGFRGILVVRGHPLLMETWSPAAHNITDEPVAEYPPKGPEAALLSSYERRAHEVLVASPVNARRRAEGKLEATDVFVFWPGQRPAHMQPFFSVYGRHAGMLSGVDLLNGIAALASITTYEFEGITDGPDNDYAAQGRGVLAMLAEQEVVFCHVEAPDAEGHDGNARGKVAALEAIDREILSRVREYALTHPLRILVMPDHPTPAASKRHSRELVPFVLSGPGIVPNAGTRMTEAEAARTGLVVTPGYTLMSMLLEDGPEKSNRG